jgi:Tfp pilus assembly protein PilO
MTPFEHADDAPSYWKQWVQPPTVITLVVAAATVYGSQVIQAERIEAMQAKVEAIERDYSRRETLAIELRNIYEQLADIKREIGGRAR